MPNSNEITIKVDLTDDSKKLLKAAAAAGAAIAAAGKGGKGKTTAKDESEDFDNVDGDEDADADEDGEDEADGEDGEEEAEETGPTRDEVQTALRAYAGASSKAAALKLMKEKGGTDALSKLKPAKFKAVIDAAKAATKKAKAAKAK